MRMTTKLGRRAVAAIALAAVGSPALVPATPVSAAPAVGETISVTLRVRPEAPRGFATTFSTTVIGLNGLARTGFCDNLDAGPVTTVTHTVRVGERLHISPTVHCYLLSNTNLEYPVTATTTVIDVPLFAVY